MDSHDIENYFRQHRKTLAVIFFAVSMLAISGVFMGMRQTEQQATYRTTHDAINHDQSAYLVDEKIPQAPTYPKIPQTQWLANRDWKFTLAELPHASLRIPTLPRATETETKAAVQQRESLRAYDGAPPVIPHAINTLTTVACTSCHGKDNTLLIGGKRPAEISHPWMANCTSCHVPQDGLRQATEPSQDRLVIDNSFVGKRSAGHGSRAYSTAPPAMPHPVWMRQNCMACHGPGREQAIRTSHPERQNCLQCHATNSKFDNRESYLAAPKPPLDHSSHP